VTHEPELAQAHADTVFWLRDGKVEKITQKKNGWGETSKGKIKESK